MFELPIENEKLEGMGEECGFFCFLKLPYLDQERVVDNFVADWSTLTIQHLSSEQKETDTRMLLHALDTIQRGSNVHTHSDLK